MTDVIARIRPYFQGRTRFALAWVFTALLIFTTTRGPSPIGILICFLGASLRFWAAGFLRKEASLAVGGPYSYTRNPLYLGTLIMAVGAFISVGAYALGLVTAILFTVNYGFVIEHEEEKLPRYFGPAYDTYCTLVPRFIPRFPAAPREELLKINPRPEVHSFDLKLAMNNKAYEAYASFAGIVVGLTLIALLRSVL
jgi:hypothetical protein